MRRNSLLTKVVCLMIALVLFLPVVSLSDEDPATCPHTTTHWKAYNDDDMHHCLFTKYCPDCGTFWPEETRTIHYVGAATRVESMPHKDPTCLEGGYETSHCGQCGTDYYRTFSALGHNMVDTVTAATCETDGYTASECTRCQYTVQKDPVAALGHDDTITTVAPTCTSGGYTMAKCSRCQRSEYKSSSAALGHLWSDPDPDGARICLREGCGETLAAEWVKAAGDAEYEVFTRVDPVDGCLYIKAPLRTSDEAAKVIAGADQDLSLSIETEGGLFTLSGSLKQNESLGFYAVPYSGDTTQLVLTKNDAPSAIQSAEIIDGVVVITTADGVVLHMAGELVEYELSESAEEEIASEPEAINFTPVETSSTEERKTIEISFGWADIVSDEEPGAGAEDSLIESAQDSTDASNILIAPFVEAGDTGIDLAEAHEEKKAVEITNTTVPVTQKVIPISIGSAHVGSDELEQVDAVTGKTVSDSDSAAGSDSGISGIAIAPTEDWSSYEIIGFVQDNQAYNDSELPEGVMATEEPEKEYAFIGDACVHGDWKSYTDEYHICGKCRRYTEPHQWNSFLSFFGKQSCIICDY